MKKILFLMTFIALASCAVRPPVGELHNVKGVIYNTVGKKEKAIYVSTDSTLVKICNYTGDKAKNDSINISYITTKYQNEFLRENE